MANLRPEHYLFPSRVVKSLHVSTRQYPRIVHQWVAAIGPDSTFQGTHTDVGLLLLSVSVLPS
jgi:hypothetical protein